MKKSQVKEHTRKGSRVKAHDRITPLALFMDYEEREILAIPFAGQMEQFGKWGFDEIHSDKIGGIYCELWYDECDEPFKGRALIIQINFIGEKEDMPLLPKGFSEEQCEKIANAIQKKWKKIT